jgi:hypothetical protein
MLAVGRSDMTLEGSDGVDVTLIGWMLSLTPAERLEQLEAFVNFVREVRSRNAAEPDTLDLRDAG